MFKSTDLGNTWIDIDLSVEVYAIIFEDNKIYVGTDDYLYVSEDNAETWYQLTNEIGNKIGYVKSIIDYTYLAMVYDDHNNRHIIKSDDGMNTWYEIYLKNNIENEKIYGLFNKITVHENAVTITAHEGICYRSLDYGNTFNWFSIGFLRDIEFLDGKYYATSASVEGNEIVKMLSVSYDTCNTWESLYVDLDFYDFIFYKNKIITTNREKLYWLPIEVVSVSESNNTSQEFCIQPNPAKTNIKISQNFKNKSGELIISNIQGKFLIKKDLINFSHNYGSIDINISSLKPGVYIVQLRSEECSTSEILLVQ